MAAKPARPQVFEIDGSTVSLSRVPVRRYDWGYTEVNGERLGHPREQALFEIRIDGEFLGHASRQHGWGKRPFAIDRLGENSDWVLGPQTVYGSVKAYKEQDLFDPETIANKALELFHAGKLKPLASLEAEVARFREQERIRTEREQANLERWEQERATSAARAEEDRLETLAGLQSIRDRLGTGLSNFETVALEKAISRYGRQP